MNDFITNLVLVRHGEAQINVDKHRADIARPQPLRYSNISNEKSPLTEAGKRQTIATARALKKKFGKFDLVLVSPYLRTRQTATLIGKYVPCSKTIIDNRLKERSKGRLELLTHSGVRAEFPEEYRRILKTGTYRYRPPEGENFPDVQKRIDSFMRDARFKGNVLVITHGASIASIMDFFEHFSIKGLMQINDHVRLCSVTCYSKNRQAIFKRRFYNRLYY